MVESLLQFSSVLFFDEIDIKFELRPYLMILEAMIFAFFFFFMLLWLELISLVRNPFIALHISIFSNIIYVKFAHRG